MSSLYHLNSASEYPYEDAEIISQDDDNINACTKFMNNNSIRSELQEECNCQDRPIDYKKCLTDKCNDQCIAYMNAELEKQVYGCSNTSNSLNIHSLCSSSCNGPPYEYTLDKNENNRRLFQDAQTDCDTENQEEIKKTLANKCSESLSSISSQGPSGAKLICEGGCDNYCQQLSGEMNCENTNTEKGRRECQELSDEIAKGLPDDPNNLPKDKFSWQKSDCDIGSPCEQDIAGHFYTAQKECQNLKDKTFLCCDTPLKCTDEETQKLLKSIDQAMAGGGGGISENCRKVKEKLSDIETVVQQMTEQCQTSISSCKEHCHTKITENVNVFKEYCSFDLNTESSYNHNKHTCSEELINLYVSKHAELIPIPAQCESKQEKADQMAQSGESILQSTLSASQCEQQARVNAPSSDKNPAGGGGVTYGSTQGSMGSPQAPGTGLSFVKTPRSTYKEGPDVIHDAGGSSGSKTKPQQTAGRTGNNQNNSHSSSGATGDKNTSGDTNKNTGKNNENKSAIDPTKASAENASKDGTVKEAKNAAGKQKESSGTGEKVDSADGGKKTKGLLSKIKKLFSKDKKGKSDDKNKSKTENGKLVDKKSKSEKENGKLSGKESKSEKDKKKSADKKNKSKKDKTAFRKYAKEGDKTNQKKSNKKKHWSQVKPKPLVNTKTGKYGSLHDNIFHRISDRITFMCRKKRILDCQ